MKISELTAVLSRVQQIAGDVDVAFRHAESDVETVITELGLKLNPDGTTGEGSLVIKHDDAANAPQPAEKPAEPSAA